MGGLPAIRAVCTHQRYRPVLHYMRGPGPKWFERRGRYARPNQSYRSPFLRAVGRRRRQDRPFVPRIAEAQILQLRGGAKRIAPRMMRPRAEIVEAADVA